MSDFFSKIDQQIDQQKDAKKSDELQKKNNEEFASQVITRLLPILEEYIAELKQRNIKVRYSSNSRSISLELLYRNGGYNSLVMNSSFDTGRIEFKNFFTNDDGKKYESTDGSSYDENTWKDDIFKKKIEKLIEDFVNYSSRHGGL